MIPHTGTGASVELARQRDYKIQKKENCHGSLKIGKKTD